ncbi:MAG: Glycine C-acetyltransferase [Microgenomates group bacterium GW2011_GWF2_45_18]|nr:MAG: Glycine C-acetyltransferase [Microgenomates group bacterium GW2011_GWF1_44_10]KKU01521.1 MAG: Glycine C-acetyltransferase [Microgenomates group bacterium GW2011_GWF2_45_18]OGJ41429.1 MAG: hypothetical protein A2378_00200 [Candidatus Pacebacteria bacterium RIFOXYB1_FULL_44_10]HAU99429.1 7-keto-8-aminopelargonate synthetase [Candidatus Paceibacterota bacterium]HAX01565.1 7-keto-8-aminopelargonate synthetase [Candidatus Paceibacterota bacterium]
MPKTQFYSSLQKEIERIDSSKSSKRFERVIESFTSENPPRAMIQGKPYLIFNSNDYLGLRLHPALRAGEERASQAFGSGPGAVRFISGTLSVHRELEKKIATFHGRDDAMVLSSAFAANMATIFCLAKGQNKDALISSNSLVISDELNHRSIIDGVRVSGLESHQKAIFRHFDAEHLSQVLQENAGKFDRVIVVTDGVFSMLGEYQDLSKIQHVIAQHDTSFAEGILLVVDDAHGAGAFGPTGRGTEEVSGAKADVLVGTLGKAFGADGGYITGDQIMIDYLRESAATYIYSNSVSPGTAGAALEAFKLFEGEEGGRLLQTSQDNIALFKRLASEKGFELASESVHPIQPLLIGDPAKAKAVTLGLFERGIIVTNINYPVVPKGRDEIRVQISASHTPESIQFFVEKVDEVLKTV